MRDQSWVRRPAAALGILLAGVALTGLAAGPSSRSGNEHGRNLGTEDVDDKALADDKDEQNWLAYGRTYSAQRFGPVAQINTSNARDLKVAWYTDLPANVGLVSTPLVAGGVMYFTDSKNIVRAVDARTGALRWTYDPKVTEASGDFMDLSLLHGGRGIAMWKGRIYLASIDGRLIAVDAATGKEVWATRTYPLGEGRFITGAPVAFHGKVVISDAGGENGKERGRITAYDAETGKMAWRFWTVPGDPSKGFENDAVKRAAQSWSGQWWKLGGGGNTFSEAYAYDPQLNTLFVGTGAGIPGPYHMRNPGGGDSLYLNSIVALDADTGKYKWHYQATPRDSWDYDNASPMILADLKIEGRVVKALMQAPKNGFFYVIDRTNGKLVSAEPYAKVNWASKIDIKTGRPVFNPAADYEITKDATVFPATWGAHDWTPISYSTQTGLVYIGKRESSDTFRDNDPAESAKFREGDAKDLFVRFPQFNVIPVSSPMKGSLIAWDPVRQRKAWEVSTPGWNPGTLSTAGNLVFQGDIEGFLNAYDAKSGERLFRYDVGLGITATPITYVLDGHQYVSILVGFGGGYAGPAGPESGKLGWAYGRHSRRVVTFALGGTATMPPLPAPKPASPIQASFSVDPSLANEGRRLFRRCSACHGSGAVSGGLAPDLRASPIVLSSGAFKSVVVDGSRRAMRMPFYKNMTDHELEALRHFIRSRAQQ